MNSTTKAPTSLPPGFKVIRHGRDPLWNPSSESLSEKDQANRMINSPRRRGTADSFVTGSKRIDPEVQSQPQLMSAHATHQSVPGMVQPHSDGLTLSLPNKNNLAKRPTYWRPDYGTRPGLGAYMNSIFKRPSSVYDPVTRNLHSMLKYRKRRPPIWFDLRSPIFAPSSLHVHVLFAGCDITDQVALSPPSSNMRIFHPKLPWYIDIMYPTSITTFHVLGYIHDYMHTSILHQDFYTEELSDDQRIVINSAFQQRWKGDQAIRSQGVKRIDYLGGECIFQGLVRSHDGLWELKTGK